MPPKRRPAPSSESSNSVSSTAVPSNASGSAVASNDADLAPPPTKKTKIVDDEEGSSVPHTLSVPQPSTLSPATSAEEDEPNSDEDDDGRELCRYDEGCYRKNPNHFTEFRHPKLKAKLKKQKKTDSSVSSHPMFMFTVAKPTSTPKPAPTPASSASSSRPSIAKKRSSLTAADLQQAVRPELDMYKQVVRSALADSMKVTVDTKKMLKKLRQDNGISEHEHDQCLGQFGWTPDEYEEGEKRDDDVELDEEREILKDEDGFQVILIRANQKRNKQQEAVWASVSSRFYQTMSKAQANYAIKSVGVIVNSKVRSAYTQKRQSMLKKDKAHHQEEWGFHGTSKDSILAIAKTGFLHPDDLAKLNEKGAKGAGKKTAAKKKAVPKIQVELLDDGYFGKGIYFSMFSDYAMWYSEERDSDQILLSKLCSGKVYQCTGRMDGQDRQPGYDSHYSPKGNEIIVFESSQVLPRYIITFEERSAEEREQED